MEYDFCKKHGEYFWKEDGCLLCQVQNVHPVEKDDENKNHRLNYFCSGAQED